MGWDKKGDCSVMGSLFVPHLGTQSGASGPSCLDSSLCSRPDLTGHGLDHGLEGAWV